MGKIDYSKITIDKLPELSNYHRERYYVWLKGKERKAEIKRQFADELNNSIEKYKEY